MSAVSVRGVTPRRLGLISASLAAFIVPLTTIIATPDTASAATTDPVTTVNALVAEVITDVNCLPHEVLAPGVPAGCASLPSV